MSVIFKPVNKITLFIIIGLCYCGTAGNQALAQTSYTTPAGLKAETKKNKKAAAAYDAEYKESHLDVSDFTYKRGAAGRRAVVVDDIPADFDNDKEINALFDSPEVTKKEKKSKRRLKEKKQRR